MMVAWVPSHDSALIELANWCIAGRWRRDTTANESLTRFKVFVLLCGSIVFLLLLSHNTRVGQRRQTVTEANLLRDYRSLANKVQGINWGRSKQSWNKNTVSWLTLTVVRLFYLRDNRHKLTGQGEHKLKSEFPFCHKLSDTQTTEQLGTRGG